MYTNDGIEYLDLTLYSDLLPFPLPESYMAKTWYSIFQSKTKTSLLSNGQDQEASKTWLLSNGQDQEASKTWLLSNGQDQEASKTWLLNQESEHRNCWGVRNPRTHGEQLMPETNGEKSAMFILEHMESSWHCQTGLALAAGSWLKLMAGSLWCSKRWCSS